MTAPTKLILKKSSVANKIPTASDLDHGELAINFADGIIYYKNSSNVVKNFRDLSPNGISYTNVDNGKEVIVRAVDLKYVLKEE